MYVFGPNPAVHTKSCGYGYTSVCQCGTCVEPGHYSTLLNLALSTMDGVECCMTATKL